MDELREEKPEVEVSVEAGGAVVAKIGFWRRDDGGFDVVAGVHDSVFRSPIADVLRAAAHQLDTVRNWEIVALPSIENPPRNETRDIPF